MTAQQIIDAMAGMNQTGSILVAREAILACERKGQLAALAHVLRLEHPQTLEVLAEGIR